MLFLNDLILTHMYKTFFESSIIDKYSERCFILRLYSFLFEKKQSFFSETKFRNFVAEAEIRKIHGAIMSTIAIRGVEL